MRPLYLLICVLRSKWYTDILGRLKSSVKLFFTSVSAVTDIYLALFWGGYVIIGNCISSPDRHFCLDYITLGAAQVSCCINEIFSGAGEVRLNFEFLSLFKIQFGSCQKSGECSTIISDLRRRN